VSLADCRQLRLRAWRGPEVAHGFKSAWFPRLAQTAYGGFACLDLRAQLDTVTHLDRSGAIPA
jgi:hypothetical protein